MNKRMNDLDEFVEKHSVFVDVMSEIYNSRKVDNNIIFNDDLIGIVEHCSYHICLLCGETFTNKLKFKKHMEKEMKRYHQQEHVHYENFVRKVKCSK